MRQYCKSDIYNQCRMDSLSPGRSVSQNYEGELKNLKNLGKESAK